MLRIPAYSSTVLLRNFVLPDDVENVPETTLVEVHMCLDYNFFKYFYFNLYSGFGFGSYELS